MIRTDYRQQYAREAATRASRAPEEQVVEPSTPPARHSAMPKLPKRNNKKAFGLVGVALAVLVVAAVLWNSVFGAGAIGHINKSGYQAVFLTNGQVFFGKLQSTAGDYAKMTKVYYIQGQSSENAKATDAGLSNVAELVKLENSVHGPKDELLIHKDQIMYFENLKDDGQAAKLIESDSNK